MEAKVIAHELVFPTCVGMNRMLAELNKGLQRVPHVRGDEPVEGELICEMFKCSPRAWG